MAGRGHTAEDEPPRKMGGPPVLEVQGLAKRFRVDGGLFRKA